MIAELPQNLQGLRDRALLLAGFAGGFRRSELAALRVEDLQTDRGWTDCAARQIEDRSGRAGKTGGPTLWFRSGDLSGARATSVAGEAGITTGPLFRGVDRLGSVSGRALHADSIAYLVKRAAGRAGLETMDYAGHSLRAGLATQAAMNGASELAIMKQTGHRSLATVRKYIREGSLFRDNAATKLGL